jgi:hypothetical protein
LASGKQGSIVVGTTTTNLNGSIPKSLAAKNLDNAQLSKMQQFTKDMGEADSSHPSNHPTVVNH